MRFPALLLSAILCAVLAYGATEGGIGPRSGQHAGSDVLVRSADQPYLPDGRVTIPQRVREVLRTVRPGMTRAQVARLCAPDTGRISSPEGIVYGLKPGELSVSRR